MYDKTKSKVLYVPVTFLEVEGDEEIERKISKTGGKEHTINVAKGNHDAQYLV